MGGRAGSSYMTWTYTYTALDDEISLFLVNTSHGEKRVLTEAKDRFVRIHDLPGSPPSTTVTLWGASVFHYYYYSQVTL